VTALLDQVAFNAGCIDVCVANMAGIVSSDPLSPAAATPMHHRRSTTMMSVDNPALGGRAPAALEAEITNVIALSFPLLSMMLQSAEIIGAAKSAGCIRALLDGFSRCGRPESLYGHFCRVRCMSCRVTSLFVWVSCGAVVATSHAMLSTRRLDS
jgi:hypothetical protein